VDALGQEKIFGSVEGIGLAAHAGFRASDTDSRRPPVTFSPPKAPPISAGLVAAATAIAEDLLCFFRDKGG